jgi:hypothetical protein
MQISQISPRLREHERLVEFMDNMAILLNCTQTLNGQFPDETRPDVVRLNTKKGLLFVGDAKNTESPRSSFTQERLLNYLVWQSSFLLGGYNRKAIFAICTNHPNNASIWINVINTLLNIAEINPARSGINNFDNDTCIIWAEALNSEISYNFEKTPCPNNIFDKLEI